MKLAALYTVFNGIELLDGSISQIYDEVDLIIICVQEISNTGLTTDQSGLSSIIEKYRNKISCIPFTPDLSVNTKVNERIKHDLMVQWAKYYDCTHFFLSACDHYYKPSEFKKYKKIIQEKDYDITFTSMNTFYKNPEWMLWPRENYFMPFITKLHSNTRVVQNPKYPVHSDPSVQVNTTENFKIFTPDEILLYHYSMIRENIRDKFNNAAASIRWKASDIKRFISEYENAKLGDEISYFQKRKLIKVENYFGI